MRSRHRRTARPRGLRRAGVLACAVTMVTGAPGTGAAQTAAPLQIEVFTTAQRPVPASHRDDVAAGHAPVDLQIYRIDGIARAESRLSDGLASDPQQARPEATRRIQALGGEEMAAIQRAALGLAKMVQYGLDRVPAIVLDGEAVVLGVTDPGEALRRYRQWRGGRAP